MMPQAQVPKGVRVEGSERAGRLALYMSILETSMSAIGNLTFPRNSA